MKMIDHNHFIAILFWGHLLNIPEYIFHWRLIYFGSACSD